MPRPWSILIVPLFACSHVPDAPGSTGEPPLRIPVGMLPVDLAAGDLDGDGAVDLVTADARDNTISVRLQRSGAWIAVDPVATGIEAHLVALTDLDGDHDLDLVATGHDSGAVFAALNDGTGHFTPAPGSPFTAFAVERPHNHGLAVGDLDGDGIADVIASDQTQRAVAVLLADGHGGLALAGPPIGVGAEAYPPALGDMNGDGHLDVVSPLVGSDGVALLLGDGHGHFAAAPGSPVHTGIARPYAITLVDADRNGTLDVFAPHDDTNAITVLLNDGHAALQAAPTSPVSAGLRLWRTAVADVDGDGIADVVGAGSGSLIVLRGDGRGGFRVWRREPAEGWSAIAVDLDADGRPDLATTDQAANTLLVWLSGPARS